MKQQVPRFENVLLYAFIIATKHTQKHIHTHKKTL